MDRKITPLIFSNSILYNQLKHVSLNTFLLRLRHVFPRASIVVVTHCAIPHHHIPCYQTPNRRHSTIPPNTISVVLVDVVDGALFFFKKTYNNFLPSCCCRFCCSEVFFLPVFHKPFFSFYVYSFFFILLDFFVGVLVLCAVICRKSEAMLNVMVRKTYAVCMGITVPSCALQQRWAFTRKELYYRVRNA